MIFLCPFPPSPPRSFFIQNRVEIDRLLIINLRQTLTLQPFYNIKRKSETGHLKHTLPHQ